MTEKARVAASGQLQGGETVIFKQREAVDILGRAGTVVGGPRLWLRAEGATLLISSLVAYSYTGQPWWLIPLALGVPDLSMAGYLWGTRVGARVYNIAHCLPLPAITVAFGWWLYKPLALALGLVWFAHIGLDSFLGYGLKYDDDFQHTHLGWIGREER